MASGHEEVPMASGHEEVRCSVSQRKPGDEGADPGRARRVDGWHHAHARTVLRQALVLKIVSPRTGRAGPACHVWARDHGGFGEVLGVIAGSVGEGLAPMPPVLVPLLRRDDEMSRTDE